MTASSDIIRTWVSSLLDQNASANERQLAARDLAQCDDDAAAEALLTIATNAGDDHAVLASAGRAIAEIWVQKDSFNKGVYVQLAPPAKKAAAEIISNKKPKWLQHHEKQTRLYVGNLSPDVDDSGLRSLFETTGKPVYVAYVILDRKTKISRCFGFVEFEKAEDAKLALMAFNGETFMDKPLIVKEAEERS